jgi:hypothetical protein
MVQGGFETSLVHFSENMAAFGRHNCYKKLHSNSLDIFSSILFDRTIFKSFLKPLKCLLEL